MKKNNKNKGFTLVELIVVLVILAILAAILVPALLGYIDNARSKQTILNARSAMIAAQAEMSSMYGTKKAATDIQDASKVSPQTTSNKSVVAVADFTNLTPTCKLFEVGCSVAYSATEKDINNLHKMYTVSWVHYQDETSEVWFDGKEWTDQKVDAPASGAYQVYKKADS